MASAGFAGGRALTESSTVRVQLGGDSSERVVPSGSARLRSLRCGWACVPACRLRGRALLRVQVRQ